MTIPLASGGWTMESVAALPENGNRYELSNGSLLVTPPPELAHSLTQRSLFKLLDAQSPNQFIVIDNGPGVLVGPSYYIPDLLVIRADAAERTKTLLAPSEVLLAVEVLSPSSRASDLGLKRYEYATAGIPDYWIVDREQRRLTVLSLNEGQSEYALTADVAAGTTYRTDRPFTLELDPDAVC